MTIDCSTARRAVRRAASKPARMPSRDRSLHSSVEGLT